METANNTIKQIALLPVICPLCLRAILLEKFCGHLEMHQHAEMTADILALSRR